MFTYGGGPDSKITSNTLYSCGGDQNYGNYCNGKATAAFNAATQGVRRREAERAPEPRRRAARGRPAVDPAVRAAEVGHQRERAPGPVLNTTSEGTPWNVGAWQLK